MRITDIRNTAWRDALQPASFRGALFHVEVGSRENGRRIVVHEFPKKDIPYPEDMGRRAKQYSVRAYCIAYPFDTGAPLYQRDYTKARDLLLTALEAEGPAVLQLPTIAPVMVVCSQYRWSEEQRLGGFCTFDMTFIEYGVTTGAQPSTVANLQSQADATAQSVVSAMSNATETLRVAALRVGGILALGGQPLPPAGP